MSELTNLIFTEKFRPKTFDELILKDKDVLIKYLNNPSTIPSFIFHSTKAGTGKTSTAKVIINHLGCDSITINAGNERGIETIRDQVIRFSMTLSSNGIKKCIFLDEADSLTKVAMESLKNHMETYSDNVFFIFSCNDLSKIIEPIRSRCILIDFENPHPGEIYKRLDNICSQEQIDNSILNDLIKSYYPDIRSCVKLLQEYKLTGTNPLTIKEDFEVFLDALIRKDIKYVTEATYSNQFDIMEFNKWMFNLVFENCEKYGLEKCSIISELLADTEKNWNIGANLQIIFLSNMLKLMRIL